MAKVQLGARVDQETNEMLTKLVEHFKGHTPFGKVSKEDVVQMAIQECYKNYVGERV